MREFSAGGQGVFLCCCKEAWMYKRFNILDAEEMILEQKKISICFKNTVSDLKFFNVK